MEQQGEATMADGAAPKTQDHFRNMFHKRPLDDAGLPPPKAEAKTEAELLSTTEEP